MRICSPIRSHPFNSVAWRPSNPSPIMRLVASGSPGEALGLDGFTPAQPGWNSTDEDGISYPGEEEYRSQGSFPRCVNVWATSNSSFSCSGTRMHLGCGDLCEETGQIDLTPCSLITRLFK